MPPWGQQPVEEVILPADGSFEPGAASEILDESTDSSAFVLLAPARNLAPSATEHFVNGLLVLGAWGRLSTGEDCLGVPCIVSPVVPCVLPEDGAGQTVGVAAAEQGASENQLT